MIQRSGQQEVSTKLSWDYTQVPENNINVNRKIGNKKVVYIYLYRKRNKKDYKIIATGNTKAALPA